MNLPNRQTCTGCGACAQACPVQCIRMTPDSEGFLTSEIKIESCIRCHLCEKICPVLNPPQAEETLLACAAYATDTSIRLDSTSGGIFSVIANHVLNQGGYISGAVYDNDFSVHHIVTNDRDMLSNIRRSKYLQSVTGNCFLEIRELLNQKRMVLFCGTPCQTAGLRLLLGKDYKNLIIVDFICLGNNSPKVFQKYIAWLTQKYGSRISRIEFKDKTFGWHNFGIKIQFENGQTYCAARGTDPFFRGFLEQRLFFRQSCSSCPCKGANRVSDLTLADFWGIEKQYPDMDQDIGTSLVLIHTEKGLSLMRNCEKQMVQKNVPIENTVLENPAFNRCVERPRESVRKSFFTDLESMGFGAAAEKYGFLTPEIYKEPRLFDFSYGARREIPMVLLRALFVLVRQIFFLTGLCKKTGWRQWPTLLKKNLFDKRIKRRPDTFLVPMAHSIIHLEDSSHIKLYRPFTFGLCQISGSSQETRLWMNHNAELIVRDDFEVYAGSYICITQNGRLILHSGFMNEGCEITCAEEINIGKNVAIARGVVIRDFDAHQLYPGHRGVSRKIIIGDHVWIGNRAMILKGVTIGDGAVIAAGAIVTKDIPANCLAAGVPAKVIREHVVWRP